MSNQEADLRKIIAAVLSIWVMEAPLDELEQLKEFAIGLNRRRSETGTEDLRTLYETLGRKSP